MKLSLTIYNAASCLLLMTCSNSGMAFTTTSPHRKASASMSLSAVSNDSGSNHQVQNRRNFLTNVMVGVASSTVATSMLVGSATPAYADVADGTELPKGVAQFGRIVRAKVELLKVQKRVAAKSDEFEQQDWDSLGQFLRKIYAVGDDMKYLANSMSPDNKTKATVLVDDLRKYSKAADGPASNKNAKEFVAYTQQLITILEKYFELLTDVPDEI